MDEITKITLEMPEEAARELKRKYEENPAEFRKHFKDLGFNIDSLFFKFEDNSEN